MRLLPIPLLLLPMLVACGARDDATDAAVADRVGDANGYAALPLQSLEPDAPLCRRGALACDVPMGAGGVVAPNGDALIRVAGGRSSVVALVRAGEDSARAFGREGAGPGEYRAPPEIDVDDAGNVYVFDLFTRRLLRFDVDGSPRAEGITQLPPAPQPLMRLVRGELWMVAAENPDAKGDTLPQFVYALTEGGAATRRHALDLRLPSFGAGEFIAMPRTFEALPQFAFGRDGRLVYAPGASAELSLFDSTGALVARGGYRTLGRAVTQADVEAAIAAQLRRVPSMGAMRDQIAERMRQAAERHPGVTQLLVMSDGEVWAREAPEAETDSVSWLVYAADLTPRQRVRMGADDRPVGTHAGRLLLARSGEDEPETGYWWMRRR